MHATPTAIPDVLVVTPDLFPDERGMFFESFNQDKIKGLGIQDTFIQDNVSISKKGVLRGLHFQTGEYAQGKLVSVIAGEVFDVAVDIRPSSVTYGKWVGVTLSGENHTMLYIPRGFAHGFVVISEEARFFYKVSGSYYVRDASSGIIWNDPTLAIDWPLSGTVPILSPQDASLPPFST